MSVPQRFYASRQGGEPGGPYTVEELRGFLNAQQLDLDDQLCVEGETTWRRLGDVAAVVPAAAAAAASKPVRAARPAGAPAAGARTAAAATRPAGYQPGARPTGPGIYLALQHAPDDLLAALQQAGEEPPAAPDPLAPMKSTRRRLTLLLLGLSFGACVIDRRMPYPGAVLSVLTPFCWLGILMVYAWTRPPVPRTLRRKIGCAFVLLPALALLVAVSLPLLSTDTHGTFGVLWVVGSVAALIAAAFGGGVPAPVRPPSLGTVRPRLELASALVKGLRDDFAPGKRLSGWLDLTGWDQVGKRLRSQKNPAGAQVELLRDEWLRLRAPLRDGNELRVSCVERLKVRRSLWRRNARGKQKLKPQRVQSLATLELALRVNGALYRTKPAGPDGRRIGQLTLAPPTVAPDSVSAVLQVVGLKAEDALAVVLALYGQLEPLPGAGRS